MIENEKIDCIDTLIFGLNRTAHWRKKMAAKYPSDPRNARAADFLTKLATDACELTDEAWSQLNDVEVRKVADCEVRFIKSATLIECSAVFDGAVPKTHLTVRGTETTGRLRDDSVSNFPSDGAFVALQRALKKLAS